jgi:hypothetical protein
MLLNVLVALYALFQIGFGIWGTVRAGEPASAIGGIAIGVLMFASLGVTQKNPRVGRIASLVIALLVVGRFGKKFFVDGVWYPAGIEVVVSLALCVALVLGHLLAMSAKKKSASPTAE